MNNYLQKIREIIHEKTGAEPEEITEDMFFEDDLNISEMELLEILEELEEAFHTDLIENKEDMESVGDLIDILTEKLE